MHKVRGLTRPNIERYTSQNHAAKKSEKLVYKNISQQRVDRSITEKKKKVPVPYSRLPNRRNKAWFLR